MCFLSSSGHTHTKKKSLKQTLSFFRVEVSNIQPEGQTWFNLVHLITFWKLKKKHKLFIFMICFVKLNMEILQYTYYIQTPRSRGLFMPTCTQHPAMSKIIKFCLWRSIKNCICSFSTMLCLVICLLAMLSYTVFISKKPHIPQTSGPQIISVWIPCVRDFSFLYCTFIWVFMLFKRQTLSHGERRDNTGGQSYAIKPEWR